MSILCLSKTQTRTPPITRTLSAVRPGKTAPAHANVVHTNRLLTLPRAGHYFANASKLPNAVAVGVIVLICFFISSFAWSWGPLGWLVPSEIHPLETRSAGQGINVAINL